MDKDEPPVRRAVAIQTLARIVGVLAALRQEFAPMIGGGFDDPLFKPIDHDALDARVGRCRPVS